MSGRVEQIGDCTLYLGDCLEIMPELGKVDAVVTDPPYGIGFRYASHKDRPENYADLIAPLSLLPRAVLQYPEEMMRFMVPAWGAPDDVLTWVCNSNLPRQTRLWGFWGTSPDWRADPQLPKNKVSKVDQEKPVRSYDWIYENLVKGNSLEKTHHPCQLPIEVSRKPIALLPHAQTILDPFLGSGTTLVACAKLGRKGIGIELDPDYFDIACRRVEEAYRQPDFFVAPPDPEKQEAFEI